MNNFEIKNNDCHAALAMTKSVQSGRSMIEMLGVLAIIGVLSVGGIAGYSKAMTKYRINKTIEQITLIAGNVRAFWGPQKNYEGVRCDCTSAGCGGQSNGDGCPIVKKAKIFPDEMITINAAGKITSITNPFGGGVALLTADKAKSGDNKAFRIHYDIGDNMEACIEIVTHDWTNAGVKAIYTMGNVGGNMYLKTPVDIAIAPDFCGRVFKNIGYAPMVFVSDIDLSSDVWKNTSWKN